MINYYTLILFNENVIKWLIDHLRDQFANIEIIITETLIFNFCFRQNLCYNTETIKMIVNPMSEYLSEY